MNKLSASPSNDILTEGFQYGQLESSIGGRDDHENLAWLVGQWMQILKLESNPRTDQNFFDLGGDSLASAELLFAVEERFRCRLSLGKFFQNPTLATLVALIREAVTEPKRRPAHRTSDTRGLIHKLQSFSGSWRGERQFNDSLLVGFHTNGSRPPIFWICQEYLAAGQLAKYLGPDQPLYAMRSCYGIVPHRDYTAEVLETVCNRYLWEMLALPLPPAFLIGGHCQGAILGFEIARRLREAGQPPFLLVLLEWDYSYGCYSAPTLLIYGEDSHLTEWRRETEVAGLDWRLDFPQGAIVSIPGDHRDVARRDNSVACLAKVLRERAVHSVPISRKNQTERGGLMIKLARRQAEAQELVAENVELRNELDSNASELANLASEFANLKASRSWRITAPLRALAKYWAPERAPKVLNLSD